MLRASQRELKRFEHILSYRADYKTSPVAALTVYLDDSGSHGDTATVVVGAWIAPYPRWTRLIREWNKAKLEYGFQVMHMAEMMANNPKSEFADKSKWNDARKLATVRRLREIIRQNALHGFPCRSVEQPTTSTSPEISESRSEGTLLMQCDAPLVLHRNGEGRTRLAKQQSSFLTAPIKRNEEKLTAFSMGCCKMNTALNIME